MIQRRALSDSVRTINSDIQRSGGSNHKIVLKERKASKRKERSRVAAQIRRNKESQTLILLQNAIPLSLPSPSQMLEKSIVIRIAGQTLFLMNTLDQVLGMDNGLTIPLLSNNFLTFFMDHLGQIIYASPNIQLLLEQHHWSNLIGMFISDVVDFKCRWPVVGEAVRLRLFTNSINSNSPSSFLSTSINSQSTCSHTAITSRLNLRKNSQAVNISSSTCSIYNVWCCTNIGHTNSKIKLLILQAVQIKSSALNNTSNIQEVSKHIILSKNSTMMLERSPSWPLLSSPRKALQDSVNYVDQQSGNNEPIRTNSNGIYQTMITSAHDRYYHFKSASTEFCQLIGEPASSIVNFNLLEIIHLDDVVKMKSFLDLIVTNKDSHVWTPLYRIMCRNGCYCVLRTLAKQYYTPSTHSLILNHILIRPAQVCENFKTVYCNESSRVCCTQGKVISMKSATHEMEVNAGKKLYVIRSDQESSITFKRKSCDTGQMIGFEKVPRSLEVNTMIVRDVQVDSSKGLKSPNRVQILQTKRGCSVNDVVLHNDPFLPIGIERCASFDPRSHDGFVNSESGRSLARSGEHTTKAHHPRLHDHFNRSPSYSLESCVLTSPGSECTDATIEDHFLWNSSNGFEEITALNSWLDEQYENDFELTLPI